MSKTDNNPEIARGFRVPVDADSVDSPRVIYGESGVSILYTTADEKYGRVVFEKLDSIKVSRGEYCPYEDDWVDGSPFYWVSKVDNSSWLKERHGYESDHYGRAYEFGRDVDEMLTDYSHYLFSFHDQFVEVIASGLWFEESEVPFKEGVLSGNHPFAPLSREGAKIIEAHELECEVRFTNLNEEQLLENTKYCSQTLMEFAPILDGSISVSMALTLRNRGGRLCSILDRYIGGELAIFEGIANLEDVKPYIEKRLGEIKKRRRELGR